MEPSAEHRQPAIVAGATRRRPTRVLVLAGAASAVLAGALWLGMSRGSTPSDHEPAKRVASVHAVRLVNASLVVQAEFPGQLVTEAADLASRVASHVRSVHVRIGDSVRAGDPLVVLDAETIARELREARAQLKSSHATAQGAEVRHAAAERELERVEPLARGRTIAEQEIDSLRSEAQSMRADSLAARAQADASRARVAVLEEQLANTRIAAPFAGTVTARKVDPGAYVRVGDPLLRLVQHEPVRVQFRIPERDIGRLDPGDPLEIRVQAAPGTHIQGRVTRLAGEVAITDRTMLVEGELDSHPSIKPGMYADVLVSVERLQDVPVVPAQAMIERIDASGSHHVGVFVVRNDTVQFVPVQIRGRNDERVAIAGQLEPGELVLVGGHRELSDGATVAASLVDGPRSSRTGS